MKELVKPLLVCALLGSPMAATAETMSCYVATPAHDEEFTPRRCFAVFCGASGARAVFRVDEPPPNNFEVLWSDTRCNSTRSTCAVGIRAFESKTMRVYPTKLTGNPANC